MKQATTGLMAASGEVINTHDQYEVGLLVHLQFVPHTNHGASAPRCSMTPVPYVTRRSTLRGRSLIHVTVRPHALVPEQRPLRACYLEQLLRALVSPAVQNLILNEPAGHLGKIVLVSRHSINYLLLRL